MIPEPIVSIITPTFNRVALLEETVDSILAQDFGAFEYLIVDDGSSDGTGAYLSGLEDPRIRVLSQENSGEVVAINRAWHEARGRYVAIVSSDDPMADNWLGEVVAALERDDATVVAYPDWKFIDEHGYTLQILRTPEYSLFDMVADFRAQPGPGALIRRSACGGLVGPRRAQFRFCADLDMWLQLALVGPFVRVPKILASWRDHPGSATTMERNRHRADELIALAYDFFSRPGLPIEVEVLRARSISRAHIAAAYVAAPTDPDYAEEMKRRAAAIFPSP